MDLTTNYHVIVYKDGASWIHRTKDKLEARQIYDDYVERGIKAEFRSTTCNCPGCDPDY